MGKNLFAHEYNKKHLYKKISLIENFRNPSLVLRHSVSNFPPNYQELGVEWYLTPLFALLLKPKYIGSNNSYVDIDIDKNLKRNEIICIKPSFHCEREVSGLYLGRMDFLKIKYVYTSTCIL